MHSEGGAGLPVTDVPIPVWIDTDAALAQAMSDVGDVIGVDTEFQRTDTFFPIAGLFQIASRHTVWLLDPLAIKDFSPFIRVLEDPAITKVMHACLEDLELIWYRLGVRPVNLFDTQLAYAYVSTRYSIGLVGLIEAELGITLEQSHTRSDWLRRPLSPGQLHYAAEDVWYLLPLHDLLLHRLRASDRVDWFVEDMAAHGSYEVEAPEHYYEGVNRAWALDQKALGRLRDLCAWREQAARQVDIPRKRVVADEQLYELARRSTISQADVSEVLTPGSARRWGPDLVRVHSASAPAELPLPMPLTQGEGKRLRRLREVAVEQAGHLQIAQELVARKRDLEALFRHYRDSNSLSPTFAGWRRAAVGERLLAELESMQGAA